MAINIESIREFVLGKPSVTEGFPFGDSVIVYKVNGKIFLLLPLDAQPLQFNVKCDPVIAAELRETYPETVLPGFHMNKKHWNTIIADGVLPGNQLLQMITDSYNLVNNKTK